MIVGDTINGAACRASHPSVPYVYVDVLSVLWCWARILEWDEQAELARMLEEGRNSLHMRKKRPLLRFEVQEL
jgi:hypothetical protein